jgi:hypothetical protein
VRVQRNGFGDDLHDLPSAAHLTDGLLNLGHRYPIGVIALGPLPHLDGVEVRVSETVPANSAVVSSEKLPSSATTT